MIDKLAILGGPKACKNLPSFTPSFSKEELAAIGALGDGLTIFSNPIVKEFERHFADFVGTKYAVSTSSCTSAMSIVLMALKEILGKINYVAVPAYSYIAIVNAILLAKLKYRLVDNDLETSSISANKLGKEDLGKGTIVVLPYMFGIHPDVDSVTKLLYDPPLNLVEDCALGLGTYYGGKHVGTFGCGCFSFAEIKTMTTAGEGGIIVTDHKDLARLCRIMSHQGVMWQDTGMSYIDSDRKPSFYDLQHRLDCSYVGQTSRMTAVQAATGIVQLHGIEEINRARWRNAKYLIDKLSHYKFFRFPNVVGDKISMSRFPIFIENGFYTSRDVFLQCLLEEGVPASIYSPRPLFEYSLVKRSCSNLVNPSNYPVAGWLARQHVLLPSYPTMNREHLTIVVSAIEKVVQALSEKQVRIAATREVAKKLDAPLGAV